MKIHTIFFKNKLRNFSYLVDLGDEKLICIDPFNNDEIQNYIKNNELPTINKIIITHDHCDHFSGCQPLVDIYSCNVCAHENAQIPSKNYNLRDGENIHQYKEWTLQSIYTPGHTLSHIAVLLLKNQIPYAIFTGDCFFNAGVGNCYNGGDVNILFQTIQNIFLNFPDEILIYPGHEYLRRNLEFSTNYESRNKDVRDFLIKIQSQDLDNFFYTTDLSIEKKINLFLRLNSSEIHNNIEIDSSIFNIEHVFIKLRELRNKW